MTGHFGNRCNCYNGHNSNSGRCHGDIEHNHAYCADCVHECGKIDLQAPNYVLSILKSTFDGTTAEVIAIYYFETGYHTTDFGRQTREWVEEQNKAMGIDPATCAAYSLCSMFDTWSNYEGMVKSLQAALHQKVESNVSTN
ncbi:MAG: hypothetical protein HY863_15585 [Chloroflexi bacterium]|nr:hypothetical protein [Chloroflexota bacterium]